MFASNFATISAIKVWTELTDNLPSGPAKHIHVRLFLPYLANNIVYWLTIWKNAWSIYHYLPSYLLYLSLLYRSLGLTYLYLYILYIILYSYIYNIWLYVRLLYIYLETSWSNHSSELTNSWPLEPRLELREWLDNPWYIWANEKIIHSPETCGYLGDDSPNPNHDYRWYMVIYFFQYMKVTTFHTDWMGDPGLPAFQLGLLSKIHNFCQLSKVCPLKKALDPKNPLDPVKSHSKIFKLKSHSSHPKFHGHPSIFVPPAPPVATSPATLGRDAQRKRPAPRRRGWAAHVDQSRCDLGCPPEFRWLGRPFDFHISFRASFPSISGIWYLFMADFQSTCSTRDRAREAEIKYTAAWERHLFADTN